VIVRSMAQVYYLTGMRGRLDHGLGKALSDRGLDVVGRELVGEFRSMTFQDQVDLVVADLQTHFWHPDARVIASDLL